MASCWLSLTLTSLPSVPLGSVPAQKQASLFADRKEETLLDSKCLLATAIITLFNVSNRTLTEALWIPGDVLGLSGCLPGGLHAPSRPVPKGRWEEVSARVAMASLVSTM
jgi:hypothetical protein